MARTISPEIAVVAWDLERLPWPALELARFPGQLHDARFGPTSGALTLVYGTGVLRTLPLAPQQVRQALDALPDPCLTAARRLQLTRQPSVDVEQADAACRSAAGRPWTLARAWLGWRAWAPRLP